MIRALTSIVFLMSWLSVLAGSKDSVITVSLPDSMKAIGLLTTVSIQSIQGKKQLQAGVQLGGISVYLESHKSKREVVMEFPKSATVIASGLGVEIEKGEFTWDFDWKLKETYQLYIATASDSAENFTIYSGYIHFPETNKWKLIGSCEVAGKWGFQQSAGAFFTNSKKNKIEISREPLWIQKSIGWVALSVTESKHPVLLPFSNIDSLDQSARDEQLIRQAMQSGKLESMKQIESVYYAILTEGTGAQVKVTDTLTVKYKGYLLTNGRVFDQTKTSPATFPLTRLIKGWQLALPACKVGGKIKIVIPSGQSYSIRTRGPKIPPNSVLVFEIEVVKAGG